jgi:CheY-like chemotaxis protein
MGVDPLQEDRTAGMAGVQDGKAASTLRVAVVEDDPASRRLVEVMLAPPFEVRSYGAGAEALREIPLVRPDVILLDISLPDMSGTEVLRQLRSLESVRNIPAIAVSAHAMAGDREKFLKAGFDAFVSKPMTESLKQTIERLVRGR